MCRQAIVAVTLVLACMTWGGCTTTRQLGGFPYISMNQGMSAYRPDTTKTVRFEHCWERLRITAYFDGLRLAATKDPELLGLRDFGIYQESMYCITLEGLPVKRGDR